MGIKQLKRAEILALARQAKLMITDGEHCFLNDMATDKEIVSLVRLVESFLLMRQHSAPLEECGTNRFPDFGTQLP